MGEDKWSSIKDHAAFSKSIQNLLKAFRNREMVTALGDYPRVDVYDAETHVVVEADLPGFKKEELSITYQEPNLCIRGQGQDIKDFERCLQLPGPVDAHQGEAELRDGVLYIALPKVEEKETEINIEINDQ